jgi:hypothetical protein
VEESADKDDEHVSFRNSADENVNMQDLLEQDTAEDIIEEDVTALIRGKKTPKDVFVLEKLFETWVSMLYSYIKMNCFREKLSVMMIKEQQ